MKIRQAVLLCVVLGIFYGFAFAEEYVVDNDDGAPGYEESGTWITSRNTGYNGGTYRYTRSTDAYSSASWTPNIAVAGAYDVYAILRVGTDRTTRAPFTIRHARGTSVVEISMYGTFAMQELYLGEFEFEAGTSGRVMLTNTGGSGVYISDAIRFTTAVDTPPDILNIEQSPSYPMAEDSVTVSARITDDGAVASASLHYSASPSGLTNQIPMLDDGLHGDGGAGDGIFGATIPPLPDGDQVTYFIRATDDAEQTGQSPAKSYVVGQAAPREYRCIWADTWNASFLNAAQAQDIVNTCRANNINTIIIEVRKIGDAYYNSALEPRATNITGGADFDPLAYILELAHDTSGGKKRIEIHAWFVMQRISRGETLSPQHILSRHPEYVMLDSNGNDNAGGSKFLDPGHPGSVEHNVAVILDCLEKYDIDGINLDYIRYPEASGSWGYNPVSIARFNAFYNKTGQPAPSDPDWGNWRRECVTLQVKKIYVKSMMLKRRPVLTADTINWGYGYTEAGYPSSSAYAGVYQDWVGWLREGIIDYNALMSYTTDNARHQGWTNLSLANDAKRGSIIGIGAYLQTTVQNSIDQLAWVRSRGAAGLNIYDWGSEVQAASPATRADFYSALKTQLYSDWADPPEPTWKTQPTTGIFQGNLTYAKAPIDHGTVVLETSPEQSTYTDGMGWYAFIDVPPGEYMLRFSKAGMGERRVRAVIPQAGDIITVDVDLAVQGRVWSIF